MTSKIGLAVGVAGLVFWTVGASPVRAQLADPDTHFLCYKPKVDKSFANHGDAPIGQVCDQFGCDSNGGKPIKAKPKLFCNPATKDTGVFPGTLPRPNDHLKCYKYKRKLPAPVHVEVSNQFGLEQLFLQKTKMFCVPTEKTVIP
jgi:hypothetical protein